MEGATNNRVCSIDYETEKEPKREMEAMDDAKKFKRYMILLILTVVLSFLVGMPSFYCIFQEKQKNAFLEGKTIWCSNGSMLVKVSKDNGYSYDEKINAFVDTNAGVAFITTSIDVRIKGAKMNQDNKSQPSDTLKRAAKALCMFTALSLVGSLSYFSYQKSGDTNELVVAIIGWLLGLFFMWIFIAKKEEWLKEKLNGFF